MKKLIPLLVVFAFLTGCAGPKEPAQSPEPTPELSAPLPLGPQATPTADWKTEAPWWTGVDADKLPARCGEPEYVDGETHYAPFQASEELGLLLYAVTRDSRDGVQFLLRKDDTLGEAFRREGSFSNGLCAFSSGDYDGDGDEEYIISLSRAGGGSDLILCEWDEAGGWTFHPYDRDVYNPQLSELLSFRSTGETVTLICGAASASYSLREHEAEAAPMEDFSGVAMLTPSGDAIAAAFGVGEVIDGTPKIFAVLRAELAYDGETFTLQAPHLEEMIGV